MTNNRWDKLIPDAAKVFILPSRYLEPLLCGHDSGQKASPPNELGARYEQSTKNPDPETPSFAESDPTKRSYLDMICT